MARFEIIGTLKGIKDTDNFHPFEVTKFGSGWETTRYKFNVISGTNRFMCEISGGKWSDDSKKQNQIYTKSRAEEGKQSENITVAWDKRRDPDTINKVAGNRIYTCNLLTSNERKALEDAGNAADAAKKNYQFLEKTEYATLVKRVIDSGKYNDAKFRIIGNIDYQYSEKRGLYYKTLTVNKIYKVPEDTSCKAELGLNVFYTEDSLSDESYDTSKKYYLNCYTDYYFSSIKKSKFVPITLVINGNGGEKSEKKAEGFKKKVTTFDDDATVRKIGFVCNMIDGAEEQAITYDDLDDETKENVDAELITLEDAIKALGGNMFGQRVTEYRVSSLARNSIRGSEATMYTEDDLKSPPIAMQEEESENIFDSDDDI